MIVGVFGAVRCVLRRLRGRGRGLGYSTLGKWNENSMPIAHIHNRPHGTVA